MANKPLSQWKFIIIDEDDVVRGTDDGDYADWVADNTFCNVIKPTDSVREIEAGDDDEYQLYLKEMEEDSEKSAD